MRRLTFALLLALIAGGATAGGGYSAHTANTLCVGSKPGCFSTIQAAVDAANDGDTILVAPGTFAGGVTIDVSIALVGAGANKTIIQGGGPVLTIGQEQATTEPTVSISRVTITGGFNNSSPDQAVTQGGGIGILQGSFQSRNGLGATVTISDSVITGNKVASQQLLPPGFCGPFDCSFANGGGIFNNGTLSLINTRVTDNQVGDPASITVVANGGGIAEGSQATLTLERSFVTGNRTTGTLPWGDTASAAGIDAPGGLTIEDSVVSGNSAQLSTKDPTDEGPKAFAGGIGIGAQATITRTIVSGNSVTVTNLTGDAVALAGGISDEGSLTLSYSTVNHNHVNASVPSSSSATAIAAGGGLLVLSEATVSNSLVSDNSISAVHPNGGVFVGGGGIANNGQLTLQRTLVIHNNGTASGAGGSAQGGGIRNDTFFGSVPQLTLTDSAVLANKLTASPGITPQGGGLFTTFPVTLTRTLIAGNQPDQCFGC
jgi:hypothetical protein